MKCDHRCERDEISMVGFVLLRLQIFLRVYDSRTPNVRIQTRAADAADGGWRPDDRGVRCLSCRPQ